MSEPPAERTSEPSGLAAPHDVYAALLTQELRLPVSAILGLTKLLEEPGPEPEAGVLQQYLALLGARAKHVARVADELTAFRELVLGEPSADAGGAVTPLEPLTRQLAGGRPVLLAIAPAAAEPAVDPDRLRLVLQVLLDCAFAVSPRGAAVRLQAEVAGQPPNLVVRVTCAGGPLPDAARDALSGPLQPAARDGDRGGRRPTGIRLSLIVGRSAAAGAGGTLILEQDAPAVFRLELPVRDDPVARSARELRERVALSDAQALRAIQDMRTARDVSIRERRAREAAVRRGARLQALHGAALALATPTLAEPTALAGLLSGIVLGAVTTMGSAGGKIVMPDEPPWSALCPPDAPPPMVAPSLGPEQAVGGDPAAGTGRDGTVGSERWQCVVLRHTGQVAREVLRPEGDAAHAFRTGEPLFVTDVHEWSRFGPFPAAVQRGVGSFAVLPLRAGARTLGVLVVDFAAAGALADEDREVVFLFAAHAAAALERVLLAHTERQLVEQSEHIAKRDVEAAALRELDRLKDELLTTIAHELRTPLTVIYGYVQMLRLRATNLAPPAVERTAERIYAAAEQLKRLVEDLTEFSRLQRGEVVLRPNTFDVVPVLRNIVDSLRTLPGGERIAGRWPVRLTVYADPARIAQAVGNLIENALRYAPDGAVTVRARPMGERRAASRSIRIEVEDRGPGIALQEQQRIWEKLYRGAGVAGLSVARGSGIGLAVVKQLVEAQGGRVGLRSTPGLGSIFWFELPAAPGSTSAGRAAIRSSPGRSPSPDGAAQGDAETLVRPRREQRPAGRRGAPAVTTTATT